MDSNIPEPEELNEDVEGHRKRALVADDEDVEGHRIKAGRRTKAGRDASDDDGEDVEGHRTKAGR